MSEEPAPVTSPDDPRLVGMGREDVPGANQIPRMLAASPGERLKCLLLRRSRGDPPTGG